MKKDGLRILVADGDSRQILPILSGLHQMGCRITTVSQSRLANGYTSRYPHRKLLFGTEDDAFLDSLLQELRQSSYDALLPLSDHSADLLTRHEAEIRELTHLAAPSRDIFLRAYDKQLTLDACMDEGVPCPRTRRQEEDLDRFLGEVGFPLVAKPRMACGSMGLKIIKSRQQLTELLQKGTILLREYVIQEYVPQNDRQINMHLVMDRDGTLASGVVTEKCRWYPVDGGASCLCKTIHEDDVLEDCVRLLRRIGWYGCCEIELIVDPRDGKAKVMEINGRASASIKITRLAGVNVARQMVEIAMGQPAFRFPDYRDDIRLRRLSADCLWLLQSPERFARRPSWFSPVRTHEATFDLRDPAPFFGTALSLLGQLTRYQDEMKKRDRN